MKRSYLTRSVWAAALVMLVAAAPALAACGGSDTATTDTVAPSPSVAATISSTPTPTPTGTWTPGAKPIPAANHPAQEGYTDGFEPTSSGWDFKPAVDIQVTHLGCFDDGGDGLLHSHPVAIFDPDDEKLLVQTTVRPHAPLDGSFRFGKIKPVTLKAGKLYTVATYSRPPYDPEIDGPVGLVFAPEIEYGGYRELLEVGFKFPGTWSPYQYISANFKFRPVSAASPTP